ncbi:hypothetical protein scyTo_0018533, partial [Scyliorhinus torazame]|nr:hypothetical protein [Scyliorhinus torazame]
SNCTLPEISRIGGSEQEHEPLLIVALHENYLLDMAPMFDSAFITVQKIYYPSLCAIGIPGKLTGL